MILVPVCAIIRSDTNQAVQPQKKVRGLMLQIEKVEGVLAKGNQFSHGPMFWFSLWKQCHYSWADTVHAVRRPSQTRWDAFQSSCLFIVLYAGKHGICFDPDALVNANTMLVALAFIDCDSSQL